FISNPRTCVLGLHPPSRSFLLFPLYRYYAHGHLHSFPTRRSSDLAASTYGTAQDQTDDVLGAFVTVDGAATVSLQTVVGQALEETFPDDPMVRWVVEATPDVPVPAAG